MNDDPQTFSCRHCGATERYDQEPFFLLAWWQAADAFDTKHFACSQTKQAGRTATKASEPTTDTTRAAEEG